MDFKLNENAFDKFVKMLAERNLSFDDLDDSSKNLFYITNVICNEENFDVLEKILWSELEKQLNWMAAKKEIEEATIKMTKEILKEKKIRNFFISN